MEPKENEKLMMIMNPRLDRLELKMVTVENRLPVYERTHVSLTRRMNELEQTMEALRWTFFVGFGLLILVGMYSRR